MKPSNVILPTIVVSQFCCTSLWFAGNSVLGELTTDFGLSANALGHLTSAVQIGFIVGTLVFALFAVADRYAPSKVFLGCALLGATFNAGVVAESNGLWSLLFLRFMTGFFLAGIYPVGMKIAADHFERGLGQSLGFLVGALVLGTAFPHLAKELTHAWPWRAVLVLTSSLAVLGGMLMVTLVPDGPYRQPGKALHPTALGGLFRKPSFRAAAFGYFGHMWELYAFWAFVPVVLQTYALAHPQAAFNVPLLSFLIIGMGGLACVGSGYLAQWVGTKRLAFFLLFLSFSCCLVSPWLLTLSSPSWVVGFLLFWGMVVVADSPLFSTLVAHHAPPTIKATALTLVNCIGFSITIVSIQLLSVLQTALDPRYLYVFLALGPLGGLLALYDPKNGLR